MKDVVGYEGLYAITSCGKVWSYKSNKFLKPGVSQDGYLRVGLSKNGKLKTIEIHKLVAQAYIPNPENKPQVNHKDEDKTHNYVGNLEWITSKENMNYGTRNERFSEKRKTYSNKKRKVYCVELDREFESISQAARETGANASKICMVCQGKRKVCGGYHW